MHHQKAGAASKNSCYHTRLTASVLTSRISVDSATRSIQSKHGHISRLLSTGSARGDDNRTEEVPSSHSPLNAM